MAEGELEKKTDEEGKKKPEIPTGKVLSGADELFDGATHVGVAIEVAASGKVSHVMIPDATKISDGKPIYITAAVELKGENLANYLKSKDVNLDNALGNLLGKARIGCEAFYFSTAKLKLETEDQVNAYNYTLIPEALKKKKGDRDNGGTLDTQEKVDAYNKKLTPPTGAAKKQDDIIERGPLLMMFEVKVDGGLIGTLSGDENLGKLFDVNSVMLRVLRCPAGKRPVLEKYVQELTRK